MKAVQQLEREIEEVRATAPATIGNSGPKTLPGKQRVALNGVAHGLTGQNVFLEAGEYPAYMGLGAQYIAELRPVGVRETQLTQKLIDTNWRLNTICAVENNLFNTTLIASLRVNDPNDDRTIAMIAKATSWRSDCEGPNAFEKLGRYESRLLRAQFKITEEIERLQANRLRRGNDTFDLASCKAWTWYDHMHALHTELAAARIVEAEAAALAAKAAAAAAESKAANASRKPSTSTIESMSSAAQLLCKKSSSMDSAQFNAAASGFVQSAVDAGLLDSAHLETLNRLTAPAKPAPAPGPAPKPRPSKSGN